MMDLSAFSSFFELFAAFTLAYAGSKTFRYAVDELLDQYGQILDELNKQLEIITSKFTVHIAVKSDTSAEFAIELGSEISNTRDLIANEEKMRKFPRGFRATFLNSGIFCIGVLIIIGFTKGIACLERTHLALFILNFALVYNVGIFLLSFLPSQCGKTRRLVWPICINLALGVVWWIYTGWFAAWLIEYCSDPANINELSERFILRRYFIWPALFTAASPFIFHILRTLIHRWLYESRLQSKLDSLKANPYIIDMLQASDDSTPPSTRQSEQELSSELDNVVGGESAQGNDVIAADNEPNSSEENTGSPNPTTKKDSRKTRR